MEGTAVPERRSAATSPMRPCGRRLARASRGGSQAPRVVASPLHACLDLHRNRGMIVVLQATTAIRICAPIEHADNSPVLTGLHTLPSTNISHICTICCVLRISRISVRRPVAPLAHAPHAPWQTVELTARTTSCGSGVTGRERGCAPAQERHRHRHDGVRQAAARTEHRNTRIAGTYPGAPMRQTRAGVCGKLTRAVPNASPVTPPLRACRPL